MPSYLLFFFSLFFSMATFAQSPAPNAPNEALPFNLDPSLNETVLYFPVQFPEKAAVLQMTIYKPNTPPPWPVVIYNHGSEDIPDHHNQKRVRPLEIARYFVSKGYLVAAPMREGFAGSSGTYLTVKNAFQCDLAKAAKFYARDVQATIDYLVGFGLAKREQVLVIGQSHGGLTSLGFAAISTSARAVINISGGIKVDSGCDWQKGLTAAGSELGKLSKIPTFWMYANDDETFPPALVTPFHQNYIDAGGDAPIKIFPSGGHAFTLTSGSSSIWGPAVNQFLEKLNLPN